MTDILQRFTFEESDIRGEWICLEESYQAASESHHYAPPVRHLLGQFLASSGLLSATLKFDGLLTLQAKSDKQIPLIMAEATSNGDLRGIARRAQQATSDDFQTLIGGGQLSITITPTKGQRYQGIVPLTGDHLGDCLQTYFEQSEQLSTRFWLAADDNRACGLMLQELPASDITPEQRAAQWEHVTTLADTLQREELLTLSGEEILHRLYHQEQVRLYPAAELQYRCSCSRERTEEMLKTLQQAELENIIEEHGEVAVNCEFCNQLYSFDLGNIRQIFQEEPPKTTH